MQLLKLAQTYNSTTPAPTRINPKQHYLNLLQSCIHVPKDDRLVIRRYLGGLKCVDERDQIVAVLARGARNGVGGRNGKENLDKKLEVLLRKYADKIRKEEQLMLAMPKPQPQVKHKKQPTPNTQKYCNNFQLLKHSLRFPTTSRHSATKSNASSIQNSIKKTSTIFSMATSPKNDQVSNYQSMRQSKEGSLTRKSQSKSRDKLDLMGKTGGFKIKGVGSPSQFVRQLKTVHYGSVTKEGKKSFSGKKEIKSKISFSKQQANTVNQQNKKHKYTRSRSLTDFNNINDKTLNQKQQQEQHQQQQPRDVSNFEDIKSHPDNESQEQHKNLKECWSTAIDSSLFESVPLNSINPLNYTMSSFFSAKQFSTKSVHTELKQLSLCSEDLLDFMVPSSAKESRCPADLSLPYSEFIGKLNQFIEKSCGIPSLCLPETVYIPFQTYYDLVTFQKLATFLEQYTYRNTKTNPVHTVYTRLEALVCGVSSFSLNLNCKRINVNQFKNTFKWKQSLVYRFEQLVRKCSRWATFITYWELYWLRGTEEYQLFCYEFYTD